MKVTAEEIGFEWGENYTDVECIEFVRKALEVQTKKYEEKVKRIFDDNYIKYCLEDLEELKKILKCEDKLDSIINLINDYKKLKCVGD